MAGEVRAILNHRFDKGRWLQYNTRANRKEAEGECDLELALTKVRAAGLV